MSESRYEMIKAVHQRGLAALERVRLAMPSSRPQTVRDDLDAVESSLLMLAALALAPANATPTPPRCPACGGATRIEILGDENFLETYYCLTCRLLVGGGYTPARLALDRQQDGGFSDGDAR